MKLTLLFLGLAAAIFGQTCASTQILAPSNITSIQARDIDVRICIPKGKTVKLTVSNAGTTSREITFKAALADREETANVDLLAGANSLLLTEVGGGTPVSVTVTATSLPPAPDERENFEASAYLGLSVDTFSAQASREILYKNPQVSGEKRERLIGGFDFGYRFWGDPSKNRKLKPWSPQLWIYGQTLHGVRSSEVDCSNPQEDERPPVCNIKANPLDPTIAAQPGQRLVYLLRNASSLEAHLGLRAEFLQLNSSGKHPARLYIKAQAGFLSIAESGGDVFDMHQLMLGALSTGGRFEGSFLEAGYGRNDVFQINRYKRALVDGYLTWGLGKLGKGAVKPFVEMFVDSDAGRGADSIQTFIGLTFDLDKLF